MFTLSNVFFLRFQREKILFSCRAMNTFFFIRLCSACSLSQSHIHSTHTNHIRTMLFLSLVLDHFFLYFNSCCTAEVWNLCYNSLSTFIRCSCFVIIFALMSYASRHFLYYNNHANSIYSRSDFFWNEIVSLARIKNIIIIADVASTQCFKGSLTYFFRQFVVVVVWMSQFALCLSFSFFSLTVAYSFYSLQLPCYLISINVRVKRRSLLFEDIENNFCGPKKQNSYSKRKEMTVEL